MTPKPSPKLLKFMDALGLTDEPMGVHYTDTEPKACLSPHSQEPVTREREIAGEVDWGSVREHFDCVLGLVWRARKKNVAACFDRERFGCLGGAFYLGFMKPYLTMHPAFISTGIPGILEGERYAQSPEAAGAFFDAMNPAPAPKPLLVVKPVSHFVDETPPVVVFFARPEVMSGLVFLTAFLTDDIESVRTPFGPGCSGLVTWPMKYLSRGERRGVLGGFDPSCRKFLKTDEMTFAVPYDLFREMIERWDESFLTTDTWKTVKKKIEKSRRTWKEA